MIKEIPVGKIFTKSNVRKENDDQISNLMLDIQTNGLLQPIVVREVDNKYEIVAGHRRFLAVKNLGLATISCNILEDCSDKERLILQLTENIQRKSMSAYELCLAFDTMREKYRCNDTQLAKILHKSPQFIADQRYAVKILNDTFGGDIPEDKKTLSAGVIKAGAKNKKSGNKEVFRYNGFTLARKGHSYMFSVGDFEFEKALNKLIDEWKDK